MAKPTHKDLIFSFLNRADIQAQIRNGELPDPFDNAREFAREAQERYPLHVPGTEAAAARNVMEWRRSQETPDHVARINEQDIHDAMMWRDERAKLRYVNEALRAGAEAARATLLDLSPFTPDAERQGESDGENELVVINLTDLHIGEGEDIDAQLAEYRELLERVIATTSTEEARCLLLLGGDLFHYDTPNQTTTRGTILQNAAPGSLHYHLSRAAGFVMWVIMAARQSFPDVAVRFIPGNHDEMAFSALTAGIVQSIKLTAQDVDIEECDVRATYAWKGHFLVADHCYHVKPEKLAQNIPVMYPREWGASSWRYIFTGHTHRTHVQDLDGGVMLMRGATPCREPSVYEQKNCYVANRHGVTVTYLPAHSGEYIVQLFQHQDEAPAP